MFDNYYHGFDDIIAQVNQTISDVILNPFDSFNNAYQDVSHAVSDGADNFLTGIINGANDFFTNAVSGLSNISQYVATYGALPPEPQQTVYVQGATYEQPRVVQQPVVPDYRQVNPNWGRSITGSELIVQNSTTNYTNVQDLNRPTYDGRIPNTGFTKYVNGVKYVYVSPDVGYAPEQSTQHNAIQNGLNSLVNGKIDINIPDITSIVTQLGSTINSLVDKQDTTMKSYTDGISHLIGAITNPASGLMSTVIEDIGGALSGALGGAVDSITNDLPYLMGSIVNQINQTNDDLVRVVGDFEGSVNRGIEYSNAALDLLSQEISNNRGLDDVDRISTLLEAFLNPMTPLYSKIKALIDLIDLYVHSLGGETSTWYDNNVRIYLEALKELLSIDITKPFKTLGDLGDISDKIVAGKYNNLEDIYQDLSIRGVNSDLIKLASSIFILFPAIGAYLGAELKPLMRGIEYATNAQHQDIIPDMSALVESFVKGFISTDEYLTNAHKLGINNSNAGLYAKIGQQYLNPLDYRSLFLRGIISEGEHDTYLKRLGFDDSQIALTKQSYNIIPTPNDLITMAVRETFSPDIASRFGQYEDFPEEFAIWASKQGLSREWSEKYWAAHWGLPSPQMGFEMYQRRIIGYEDLQRLLKALDIMPYWRDKLTNLAYNPLTRVDVRRMYKLGVLDDEEMINAYRDIGYNEANAQKLAEFTKKYETASGDTIKEKIDSRTVTAVERLFAKGKITEQDAINRLSNAGLHIEDINKHIELLKLEKASNDAPDKTSDNIKRIEKFVNDGVMNGTVPLESARNYLSQIGYSTSEIDSELSMLQLERDARFKQQIIDNLQELYTKRTIDKNEVTIQLSTRGFNSNEIQIIVNQLEFNRTLRSKKPSEAALKQLYNSGLITIDEYKEELRGLGYVEKYVDMLTTLNTGIDTNEA